MVGGWGEKGRHFRETINTHDEVKNDAKTTQKERTQKTKKNSYHIVDPSGIKKIST